MIDRRFVVSFLQLNNIDESASEKTIEEALLRAKWTKAEARRALALLKDPSGNRMISEYANEYMFVPHAHLSSHKISHLLGVDIIIDPSAAPAPRDVQAHPRSFVVTTFIFLVAALLTIGVATAMGLLFMYLTGAGVFYTS